VEASTALAKAGLQHRVLNAAEDHAEAEIISRAGEMEQIMIATNMAGRGADIPLGPGVADLGGLHVIVSELHQARRIDRQVFGRCARHGEPGSFQRAG
jgi:preprotein translocase subunit SecA